MIGLTRVSLLVVVVGPIRMRTRSRICFAENWKTGSFESLWKMFEYRMDRVSWSNISKELYCARFHRVLIFVEFFSFGYHNYIIRLILGWTLLRTISCDNEVGYTRSGYIANSRVWFASVPGLFRVGFSIPMEFLFVRLTNSQKLSWEISWWLVLDPRRCDHISPTSSKTYTYTYIRT